MSAKPPFRNSLIVFGMLALFSVVAAMLAYWNVQSFLKTARRTQGQVIGFQPQRKVFKPIVAFQTEEGKRIEFVAPIGSVDTFVVKTGSRVKVLYHPSSPQDAAIEDFWFIWNNTIMLASFGVAPFLLVLMLRLVLVPRRSPSAS
ncbi:MAG: DUF3592 domain-containing protein [Microscillaceae bacterium]|nr:DUF3592 domain-containing protein [Microscillaceae bacterium]